jgi:uncharacterized protein (DUF486 family)
MELLKKRAANLLCIKSLVTLVFTAVFAVLALRGDVREEQYITLLTMILGFYFGTQARKETSEKSDGNG